MYGGNNPGSLSLMVDAVADSGHSHNRRPCILALADRGSVLLMSLGYMERNPQDHNMPQVIDYEGYPYDNTEYHLPNSNNIVRKATAVDMGPVGYGRVRLEKYLGYPCRLDREIVFIKSGGIVIKDSLTMSVDLKLRWGSLFRTRNVGPDYGDHWVNTYLGEWIPLRGLGRNAPVYTRWRNLPRDLLIYFLPNTQGKLEIIDESTTDRTCPLPVRVQYTLRQSTAPDVLLCCRTLLLSHPPGNAQELADKVTVFLDEPRRTALKFMDAEGASHFGIINHSGKAIQLPGIQTDGEIAYVQQKDGKVVCVALHRGKSLTVGGRNLASRARSAQVNSAPEE